MKLFGNSRTPAVPDVTGEAGSRIDLAGQLAARRATAQAELNTLVTPHPAGGWQSLPADAPRIAQLEAEISQIAAEQAKR